MKTFLAILCALCLFAVDGRPEARPSYVRIDFCELLNSPEKYNGKLVTTKATYHPWYEGSDLYCLDCLDKGRAWLEIPFDLDDASERILHRAPRGEGLVNLTLQGIFRGRGNFGHQNGYPYQLTATKIIDLAVIQKGMQSIEERRQAEQRWGCGGINPR